MYTNFRQISRSCVYQKSAINIKYIINKLIIKMRWYIIFNNFFFNKSFSFKEQQSCVEQEWYINVERL